MGSKSVRTACSAGCSCWPSFQGSRSASSQSGGFLIYDLSGEASGRASSVSAGITEPAAVWFNRRRSPSPLAAALRLEGSSSGAVALFSVGRQAARPAAERGISFSPPFLPAPRSAIGWRWDGRLHGVRYRDPLARRWRGREAAIAASLVTLALNPTVSSSCIAALPGRVSTHSRRGLTSRTVSRAVGGDVRWQAAPGATARTPLCLPRGTERLHLALTYRSRVKMSFATVRRPTSPGQPDSFPCSSINPAGRHHGSRHHTVG